MRDVNTPFVPPLPLTPTFSRSVPQNLYAAGTRYRQRIEDLREFARFHRLSPSLRAKIYNYVDFQWSVTNGIDVDKIAAGLPAHLQLEMKVQLNKRLVEQVSLFVGCPREFFEALVCKLQPCICIQDDYVFYKGELGSSMYFMRRGIAEVLTSEGVVLASLREGDYFGEMALLADAPRTADVRAATDLVMLSLSSDDLQEILEVYPQARTRMRAKAEERLTKLQTADSAKVANTLATSRKMSMRKRMSWGGRGNSVTSCTSPTDSSSSANTQGPGLSAVDHLAEIGEGEAKEGEGDDEPKAEPAKKRSQSLAPGPRFSMDHGKMPAKSRGFEDEGAAAAAAANPHCRRCSCGAGERISGTSAFPRFRGSLGGRGSRGSIGPAPETIEEGDSQAPSPSWLPLSGAALRNAARRRVSFWA